MSDIALLREVQAFIQEFEKDVLEKLPIAFDGRVRHIGLSWSDDYIVRLYTVLLDDNHDELELMVNYQVYNPQWDDEMLVDQLYGLLADKMSTNEGLVEKIEARLAKINLLSKAKD